MKKRIIGGLAGTLTLLGVGCTMMPYQTTLNGVVSDKGAIRISLDGAARNTQARLEDISYVEFTVESPNKATNALSPTAIANSTVNYSNGSPTTNPVLFNNLWPGEATISAAVYGGNPIRIQSFHTLGHIDPIGSATATASVVGGQVTTVPMSIKLDATQTRAGSLDINLAVQPGDENLVLMPYQVTTFAGNGVAGTDNGNGTAAYLNNPNGVAVDAAGNVYVADSNNHMIRKITPSGVVSTFAGHDSPGSSTGNGTAAAFWGPLALAVDAGGNVYVGDAVNSKIRKITPNADVSDLAGSMPFGSSDGQGVAAKFDGLTGIAVDATGDIYVADVNNHAIRKCTPGGNVTTIAGTKGVSGASNANGSAATFKSPRGVAVDSAGNVFVADTGNHMIRKIATNGDVSTFAGSLTHGLRDGNGTEAQFYEPMGMAIDAEDNLYVADCRNHTIRKITPNGLVSTLAGFGWQGCLNGPATASSFYYPTGVAVDLNGKIYVADSANHMIRRIFY